MNKNITERDLMAYFSKIAEDLPISMAYLYGSFLDETFNESSDIDIALVIKEKLDKSQRMKLEMKITSLLDHEFKMPFDVRTINEAPLKVKGEVVTHGKLIYCADEEFRVDFETYIRDRYFDFLPSLHSMRKVYFDSVKSGGLIGQT
jgi:predicted nucleotidyltransferase